MREILIKFMSGDIKDTHLKRLSRYAADMVNSEQYKFMNEIITLSKESIEVYSSDENRKKSADTLLGELNGLSMVKRILKDLVDAEQNLKENKKEEKKLKKEVDESDIPLDNQFEESSEHEIM